MSKRILLCTDGTWDTPRDNTNVERTFKAAKDQPNQIAIYDKGVGTDSVPLQCLSGGAFGEGLFAKIKDGYRQVAAVYEPGDDLFLFGFSRGAYTARSIAGMIAVCGLPTAGSDDHLVNTAFTAYRELDLENRAAILDTLADYQLFDAKIRMVGVWDTVGSLGIPAMWGRVDPLEYGFLDTRLHPDVLNAYQAVAIDERRRQFPPTLWRRPSSPVEGQTLEQVWFSGVHCDVGGGYSEHGLSDITFAWMLSKAVNLGLEVDPSVAAQYVLPLDRTLALDTLHESWDIFWLFPKRRVISEAATLDNSVRIRCQCDKTYRPRNLTLSDGIPSNSYQVVPVVA